MLGRLRGFGAFLYDFVIGDDWRVAVAVVAGLLATWAVSTTVVPAWWIAPVMVATLVPYSLWRAVKRS